MPSAQNHFYAIVVYSGSLHDLSLYSNRVFQWVEGNWMNMFSKMISVFAFEPQTFKQMARI